MISAAANHATVPDPVTRFSVRLHGGFIWYLRWYLRRHFHSVLVSSQNLPQIPAGKALIIYSNHPSWWDPMLFMLIGASLMPAYRGFGPMDAPSLKRYAILERLGAFGVERDSARGGLLFMVMAQRILANPAHILWLTAEGAFTDVRHRPVEIREGLGFLAHRLPGVCVLPLALEYPFWNESRPEALCRFGELIELDGVAERRRTSAEWNSVFSAALSDAMDRLSRESMQRDPKPFRSLLAGTSGVGGVYDAWRRVSAWRRGNRFDSSHEPPP